jgi:ABC-type multidrug transport system ATPase subunit
MVPQQKARERMSDNEDAAIYVNDISKRYGDERLALNGVTFEIARGELVALVGSNGAGKSTLLQISVGLLEATDGEVLVDGVPAGSLDARARVSYISDQPALYDDLSVNEHIEYVARLHGLPGRPDTADELLEMLNLERRADDLPARFSRGLRQKTAIVLALIRPFSVLLVDEPFVGLDPAGQEALTELLGAATDAGAAVVVATHQLAFLERATRCIALRDGGLVYDDVVDRNAIEEYLE